jgi:hypothetical protein
VIGQSTEYAVAFSAGASAAMYIYRQVTQLVYEKRNGKNGNGAFNGSSGTRPVEFWQQEFRRAFTEGFSSSVAPILENQNRILTDVRDSQKDIAKALTDLAVSQARGHRG